MVVQSRSATLCHARRGWSGTQGAAGPVESAAAECCVKVVKPVVGCVPLAAAGPGRVPLRQQTLVSL